MQQADKVHPPYLVIWGVLAVLMVAKVLLATLFPGIPKVWMIVILCGLAAYKASLVALYYMHLKFEPKRLTLMVVSPLLLAAILVLFVLTEVT
jgi:cytochrome c oxidase subunit IV